jgi:hypothetical protein
MFAGLLAVLGIFALVVLYIVGSTIFNGWVLAKLWNWFMVPIFGFKPLTIITAIAISTVFSFIRGVRYADVAAATEDARKKKGWGTFTLISRPFIEGAVTLLFAMVVRHYM